MEHLDQALIAPATSPEAAALAAWLRALERTGDGWERLFDALRPHSERVAREFSDVATSDDALGECMALAYERWMAEWLDDAEHHHAAFGYFVADRLRDRLRAWRRRRLRRAAFDRARLDEAPTREGDSADAAVRVREMYERLEAHPEVDAGAREVLWMLARGHSQKEIARIIGASEPTVSRAVSRLRALLDEIART